MNFNLDIGIFLGFLVLNLAVGLYYGRGVKTIEGYALGGRNFSTGALVATLVATCATGSGFFTTIAKTYSDGLHFVIISMGMAFSLYAIGAWFVPRMGEFLGKLSVAEVMGDFYGTKVRTITAIAGTIGTAGLIAVQFKAFGAIFNYFLGFSPAFSVILAGSIVTIYSAFGGVRSVTFTDVLQFTTFGVAIPLVGLLIWHNLHSMPDFSIVNAFHNPRFDYSEVLSFNNHKFWEMLPLLLYFMIPGFEPYIFQRVLMGKNVAQAKKAFIIATILFIVIKLSMEWIPFLIYSVDSTLQPNQLLSYIIDHYTVPGLKGLIIISIASLAMSTADSAINTSAVLVTHDICRPLGINVKHELWWSKIFAIAFGIIAITLTFVGEDLLEITLFASSFYIPIVTAPLIMTIYGFRSSTKSVLIAMSAGFVTSMILRLYNVSEALNIIIAILANLLFLVSSHYLLKQPGGWVGIKDTRYLDDLRAEKMRSNKKFIRSFKDFSILKFLEKHSPSSELAYTGFGIYCIIYTFTTMYSTQAELLQEHGRIILTMYQIMLVTGVVMALYPIWPSRLKNEWVIRSWWNIAIFYMLTLFSAFFVLISQFGSLQFMVFTVNTIIVIILSGWRFGSIMMLIGFYLGFESYKMYTGSDAMDINHSPIAMILYTFLLLSSVVVIFLKPRQEAQELAWEKVEDLMSRIDDYRDELYKATEVKNEFLRNLQHEAHTPITGITSMAQVIDESYDKLPEDKKREAIHNIASSAERLISYVDNIIDLSKLSTMKYDIKLEKVNLSELLYEHIARCKKLYIPPKNIDDREFVLNIDDDDVLVKCDRYYVGRSIDNIIINAIQYCKKGKIAISLVKHKNAVVLNIKDEGIGIPLDELHDVFGAFTVSAKTHTPAGGRGVGLALVKKIMDLHKGEVWADSDGKSWTMVEMALRV